MTEGKHSLSKINWDMFSMMFVQATDEGSENLVGKCFRKVSVVLSLVQLYEMFGAGPGTNNCVHHLCFLCYTSVPLLQKSHQNFGLWHLHLLPVKNRTQSSPLKPTWISFLALFGFSSVGHMHFNPGVIDLLIIFSIILWLSNVI